MSLFDEKPFSESHLDSPEYRRRLMRKLNTLIAVLEVACAKVRRSLAGPDPDVERLQRIQRNLDETLKVCVRAKRALERCADPQPDAEAHEGEPGCSPLARPRGAAVEMTSREEAQRFSELGPIDPREVRDCDLDQLCRQLLTRG